MLSLTTLGKQWQGSVHSKCWWNNMEKRTWPEVGFKLWLLWPFETNPPERWWSTFCVCSVDLEFTVHEMEGKVFTAKRCLFLLCPQSRSLFSSVPLLCCMSRCLWRHSLTTTLRMTTPSHVKRLDSPSRRAPSFRSWAKMMQRGGRRNLRVTLTPVLAWSRPSSSRRGKKQPYKTNLFCVLLLLNKAGSTVSTPVTVI